MCDIIVKYSGIGDLMRAKDLVIGHVSHHSNDVSLILQVFLTHFLLHYQSMLCALQQRTLLDVGIRDSHTFQDKNIIETKVADPESSQSLLSALDQLEFDILSILDGASLWTQSTSTTRMMRISVNHDTS